MSSSSTASSDGSSPYDAAEQAGIVDHFQSMEGYFLGNAELGNHILPTPDGKDRNNTRYETPAGVPYRFHVYGSLVSLEGGSKISAAGNHVSGDGAYFKPLRDSSVMGRNSKDVHLLVEPRWASPAMRAQFRNSIRVLNAIEDNKESADSDKPVRVYSWVKSSDGTEVDQIIVHSSNKYGKPSVNDAALITAPRRTSKLDVDSATEASIVDKANETGNSKKVGRLGAWYEPNVQPDWNNSGYFDLKIDKLKQQNINDVEGDLVHPCNTYDVLRPGTLVEYVCELHVYDIVNKYGKNQGLNRYYQIQFIEAHVLLNSVEKPDVRPTLTVPPEYSMLQSMKTPSAASGSVPDFQSYAQKRREAQRMKANETTETASKPALNNKRPRAQVLSEKAKGKKKDVSQAVDLLADGDMNVD